ncbi:MAG: AmmeMemoRadiSam system protein A [Clostridiales bacterium]|nr:AmmeMemoRadiSam system protein A [Clostridiales bacterium]
MSILASFLMPHAPVFLEAIGQHQIRAVEKTIESMHKIGKTIKELKPDMIVFVSPHGPVFSDAIAVYDLEPYTGDFHAFGEFELEYEFKVESKFLKLLCELSDEHGLDYYPLKKNQFKEFHHDPKLDHGVLVPAHFIYQHVDNIPMVAMSYGTFPYLRLIKNGKLLKTVSDKLGLNIVVIASGDMSHALKDSGPYAFDPNGPWFDALMTKFIDEQKPWAIFTESLDKIEHARECGLRSFAVMLGALEGSNFNSKVLSYEGPFGVGYLCASFIKVDDGVDMDWLIKMENKLQNQYEAHIKKEHFLVKFARLVVEERVKGRVPPKLSITDEFVKVNNRSLKLPEDHGFLKTRRGIFVSIKNESGLRGCIGTILPTQDNIIDEIYRNSIAAATKDYRFNPIEADELQNLIISVDVLSELEEVEDRGELSPDRYGVIVSSRGRQGVLLPNLESIETVDEQLRIACNKGGFSVDEMDKIMRFTVDRFK